jgi:hypothetical protein
MKGGFMKKIVPTISLLLVLAGCVTTKVASLVDPDYKNASFRRVLVIANFANIDAMKKFETFAAHRLKDKGLYAIENHLLLPPLREYTDEEKRRAFVGERLDCYLIISPKGVNTGTIYVPTISSTQVDVNAQKNRARGSSTTVTSQGGGRDVVSSVDTQGELFDFQNGRIAWRGDANSQIPYYGARPMGEPDDVFKSACHEIVDQMIQDGVLAKSK